MHPASLQSELRLLREQIASLKEALEQSRRENTLLRQKLDALARRFFGQKSEQLNAAQLELLLSGLSENSVDSAEAEEPPAAQPPRRSRTRNTRRIRTPDNLEVVRQVIEPELVQAEPQHWKRISQEVSRQLDYQPGKFFWQEIVRPKYVRRDQRSQPPVVAPAPERVAEPVWPPPVCWRSCWSANTATTCPSTGRNRSSGNGTRCSLPGSRWCNGPNKACGCSRASRTV